MPLEMTWLDRLIEAIDQSGRSMREISLSAGFGHAYLREVIELGKEPKLGSLMAICAELNISPTYILTGLDLSPESEEVVRLLARLSPEKQEEFGRLLKVLMPEDTEPPMFRAVQRA